MSTTPDQTPAEQCEQHPTAPRIDGKCGGCTQYPTDREQPTDRLIVLDGRDALAFVVIRPADEDPERIAVEASAHGISKAVTAYALRQTADQFDRDALAEGATPITAEEAAAEQQQRPASPSAALAAAGREALPGMLRGMLQAAEAATLRARVAELETETAALQRDKEHIAQAAEARVNGTARRLAEQITALGKARRWSTWAADYIHPERTFVDPGKDDEQRPAVEEQPADWVADVRAAIAFNRPEREPALETLRDVLLDTAPRTAEQALAAARLILAAHTRDQATAVRKHIDAYRDEHGVNRSTRGLITGMDSIRRLLDQRADALDAEAQP
ncbi:hypothetical protein ACWCV2_22825 [Streptomyces pseudogriseolus]